MSREIRAASARTRDAVLHAIERMVEANSVKSQAAADDVTFDVTGALGRAATADDVTSDVTGAQRRGAIAADVTSDVTGAQGRDPPADDITSDVTGIKEKGTASANVAQDVPGEDDDAIDVIIDVSGPKKANDVTRTDDDRPIYVEINIGTKEVVAESREPRIGLSKEQFDQVVSEMKTWLEESDSEEEDTAQAIAAAVDKMLKPAKQQVAKQANKIAEELKKVSIGKAKDAFVAVISKTSRPANPVAIYLDDEESEESDDYGETIQLTPEQKLYADDIIRFHQLGLLPFAQAYIAIRARVGCGSRIPTMDQNDFIGKLFRDARREPLDKGMTAYIKAALGMHERGFLSYEEAFKRIEELTKEKPVKPALPAVTRAADEAPAASRRLKPSTLLDVAFKPWPRREPDLNEILPGMPPSQPEPEKPKKKAESSFNWLGNDLYVPKLRPLQKPAQLPVSKTGPSPSLFEIFRHREHEDLNPNLEWPTITESSSAAAGRWKTCSLNQKSLSSKKPENPGRPRFQKGRYLDSLTSHFVDLKKRKPALGFSKVPIEEDALSDISEEYSPILDKGPSDDSQKSECTECYHWHTCQRCSDRVTAMTRVEREEDRNRMARAIAKTAFRGCDEDGVRRWFAADGRPLNSRGLPTFTAEERRQFANRDLLIEAADSLRFDFWGREYADYPLPPPEDASDPCPLWKPRRPENK